MARIARTSGQDTVEPKRRRARSRHRKITTTTFHPATFQKLGFSFDRIVLYRSPLSLLGTLFLVMVTISFAVVLTRLVPASIVEVPLPFDRVSHIPVMVLFPLVFFLKLMIELLDSKYVLTPKGVVEFHGLLISRRVRRVVLPFGILREVTVHQPGFSRLLRVGDLVLRGVEQNGFIRKIVIRGIHQPQAWRTILLEQAKFRPSELAGSSVRSNGGVRRARVHPIFHQPGELLVH